MSTLAPTFADWIAVAEDPAQRDIFFLGAADSRITFYSQQVRALRLAHALDATGRLKSSDRVAVVGAGAAGVTAALAFVSLGLRVDLIEKTNDVIHLQSASPRLLHPNIYSWPEPGSLQTDACLPFLDWAAATGQVVRDKLKDEFDRALASGKPLNFRKKSVLKELARTGGQLSVTLASDGVESVHDFEKVILAMGFGDEQQLGDAPLIDYWRTIGIGSPALEISDADYLVSGNGDGALTDLMRLVITGFDHVKFTHEFLSLCPQPDLARAVMVAEARVAMGGDLECEFNDQVLPILKRRGAIDSLQKQLRRDRSIVLNARGPLLAKGKAARLNQVMAFAILRASKEASVKITRSVGKIQGVTKTSNSFSVDGPLVDGAPLRVPLDMVILRHGPNRGARYQPVSALYSGYRSHLGALLAGTPTLGDPPRLHATTFAYFDPRYSAAFLDLQSQQARSARAQVRQAVVLIRWDEAAHIATQQGAQDLASVAAACECLSTPATLHFDALPSRLDGHSDVLLRIVRASAGKLKATSTPDHASQWREIEPAIGADNAFSSPESIRELPPVDALWTALDECLLRCLDKGLDGVVSSLVCDAIGPIHADIAATLPPTWKQWRATIDASAAVRVDFLRLLFRVEQAGSDRWDGNHACVPNLIAALVLMLATHAGEALVPAQHPRGNLLFRGDAVGLGSGCDRVLGQNIADLQDPELWSVDALILSGAKEEMFADAGLIRDGGEAPPTMLRPTHVAPAVVQNTRVWRQRLQAGLTQWKPAILQEFARWRARQDAQLQGSP